MISSLTNAIDSIVGGPISRVCIGSAPGKSCLPQAIPLLVKIRKKICNFDACDEFFKTVVVCHILALAMHFLGMASFDDLSRSSVLPADAYMCDIVTI